jgi:hypothetical protein
MKVYFFTFLFLNHFAFAASSPLFFKQRVDHFKPKSSNTFEQRYFLDSTYVKPGQEFQAPVLLWLCGEEACDDNPFRDGLLSFARGLGAHLVALEHRYYGSSIPSSTLSTQEMKFLTMEQALADVSHFESYVIRHHNLNGPWIVIGGSYSGQLAAYYREKYPLNVVGALASSAPVRLSEVNELEDYRVFQTLGKECSQKVQQVTGYIEAHLDNPNEIQKLKALFGVPKLVSNVDFLWVVMQSPLFAAQYGQENSFCKSLNVSDDDLVSEFAKAGISIFKWLEINPMSLTPQGLQSTDPHDTSQTPGLRQWFYQMCTQLGDFPVAYHDPKLSTRSQLINVAYFHNFCRRTYGIVPQKEALARLNSKYYLPLLSTAVSKILFTNGSEDPVAEYSISHENGNGTNPNTVAFTLQGESHTGDIFGDKDHPAVAQAQHLFLDLAESWIQKCIR